jgi:hypothetical protein
LRADGTCTVRVHRTGANEDTGKTGAFTVELMIA